MSVRDATNFRKKGKPNYCTNASKGVQIKDAL